MNTTITIHLAHTLFHIDSDAYDLLKNYLNKLEKSFKNTEGKQEILEDIEVRIAELFSQYAIRDGYVISVQNTTDVIKTLGSPEDISEDNNSDDSSESDIQKKLYRDGEENILGGVASGLGYYFGIERIYVRLILLFLFLSSVGGVLFIYILLWALLPVAKTTSEKLRMRGKPVNISNIESKIKEGLDDVTQKVKDVDYSKVGDDLKKNTKRFSEILESTLILLIKLARKIIGFFMIVVSSLTLIFLLFGVAILGFISSIEIPHEILFLSMNTDIPAWTISIIVFFGIGIPNVFLFVLGLRLLTSKRKIMSNSTKYTLGVLWITTILLSAFIIAREFRTNLFTAKNNTEMPIDISKTDTLQIRMNQLQYEDEILVFNDKRIIYSDEENLKLIQEDIRLNIVNGQDNISELKLEKRAKGVNQKNAHENANTIEYDYEYYNKSLLLDSNWLSSIGQSRNDQEVRLTLSIPEGQYVFIDRDLSPILNRKIKNDKNYSRRKVAGHLWKMENKILVCQDCNSTSGNLSIEEDNLSLKLSDEENNIEININENGVEINTREQ
ncbi:PspC domain-containing protein [Flavobacteriaceae bacterium]|uniref:PspC domain-containing protein n=1 Tax=Candidatus Arcticimaribacter forsetii TaxID=2820661 RepID=UPI00207793AD|nr:PspC domain-containing protein [Candidatus Arcticimaribacter forsetii]MDB2345625.1 PspC domain-containing protein [Flavobacteriaceae bacterium]MDB4674827.1 PspC domain-containing protein [Flavobacteriaceae bacterium]MDC0960189.1 PspC domain-containing protein [Flavobacteriaceae bacterium]